MRQRIRAAFAAALLTVSVLFQTGCAGGSEPEAIGLLAAATEKTVMLRWDTVEGADRYRLLRKSADARDFKFVCDVMEGNTYTDKYVEQGIAYEYKIKVYAGSRELACGVCDPLALLMPPVITAIRQIEGNTYEAEWDKTGKECIVYGETAAGWIEIGRGNDGRLRFQNTENCTALAVASAGEDTIRSAAVPFTGVGSVLSATALDAYTNAVELDVPSGQWKYEIARSETKDGAFTVVGSAENNVYYDVAEAENTAPCWYRFRCLGDRAESVWSEPVQLGTNARQIFYVPIVLYHEFLTADELDGTIEFEEDVITPEEFESDLIWLKNHGYSPITTAALVEYLEGGAALPEKPIILSIDDGKYGVYKWAWPLLMKYGMQASLAVIGSLIDSATENPATRLNTLAPYCNWDEIREMHASGTMEIISHTQSMHAFNHDGRQGANCAPGETAEQYLPAARTDAKAIINKIEKITGSAVTAMAYPYSLRSTESDRAWLAAGYKLLLCGNNDAVHTSKWNPTIREAGLNEYSSRLRRIARIMGTPIGNYLRSYENFLTQNSAG